MTSKEVSFPRGKSETKSLDSMKRKKRNEEDRPESLFVDRKTEKKKRRNNGQWTAQHQDNPGIDEDHIVIERITERSLPVDTTIIGYISSITDYEVLMSIPGNINVSVDVFSISSPYSTAVESFAKGSSTEAPVTPHSLLTVGQCLPVKILEISSSHSKARHKVKGSINPSDVHQDVVLSNLKSVANEVVFPAAVESVQDHGYILDLGFGDKLHAFLPLKDSSYVSSRLGMKRIPVGSVFMVTGVSLSGRVLTVTANERLLSKKIMTGDDSLVSAHSLLPGSKVKCMVMDIKEESGISIVAANEVRGYIHKDYLESEWDVLSTKDEKSKYRIGETIIASVLFVHSQAKQVVCSLRLIPFECNQVTDCKILQDFKVGMLIQDARVVHIETRSHAVILKSKKSGVKMIASKSQLKDTSVLDDDIIQEFAIGSEHAVRVLAANFFERILRVSLKPSVVKQSDTIDLDSLNVGDVMTGRVVQLLDFGLIVSLGFNTNCIVRKIHLVDSISVTNFERLFPLDKEVKVRILNINREKPEIHGTCKKSLFSLKGGEVLDSFSKAVPGFVTDGVVVSSTQKGVLLEFFANIRGFISPLLLQEYSDIKESFKPGQVVKVRVISSDESTQRIQLSLSSQDNPQSIIESHLKRKIVKAKETKGKKAVTVGSYEMARITNFTEKGLCLKLSQNKEQATVLVPYTHLSDGPSMCKKDFYKKYAQTTQDISVRIFSNRRTKEGSSVTATLKPTLMLPVIKPVCHRDIKQGMTMIGVISNSCSVGTVVEFMGGVTGLIPKKQLQDVSPELKEEYKSFSSGHLVACKVSGVKEQDKKTNFIMSLVSLKQELARRSASRKKTTSATSSIFEEEDSPEEKGDNERDEDEGMPEEDMIDLIAELKTGLQESRKRTVSSATSITVDSLMSCQESLPFQVDVNPSKITFADDDEDLETEENSFDTEDNEVENNNGMENSDSKNIKSSVKSGKEDKKLSKYEMSKQKESKLRAKEAALASTEKIAESMEELERNVVSYPNSSYHWLQLMSRLLDNNEIEKCRGVGERALNAISFREEGEKFNIWIALINLEHIHGTTSSLKAMISRALSAMDQKRVYLHLTSMYHKSGKHKEADETFSILVKKFRQVSLFIL
jgi:rRNA biogenesis protein RRP5